MIKHERIGQGVYGIVYACEKETEQVRELDTPNQRSTASDGKHRYALKRNLVDKETNFIGNIRELQILSTLRGHHSIAYLDSICLGDPFSNRPFSPIKINGYRDDGLHFIFNCADCDLYRIIENNKGGLNEDQVKLILLYLLLGIEYFHARKIVHRDIKPQNILYINRYFQICDFGISKPYTLQGSQTPKAVTSWYRAPEVVLGYKYGLKIDIWSLGCVTHEVVTGSPLMLDVKDNDLSLITRILTVLPEECVQELKKIEIGPITIDATVGKESLFNHPGYANKSADFRFILSRMLMFSPSERWSATQLLNDKYFDQYRTQIERMRKEAPPSPIPSPVLRLVNCNERRWAAEVANAIFLNSSKFDWYKHRILFTAVDLFDRYLEWAEFSSSIVKAPYESEERGRFHSRFGSELRFHICLYIAVKYFIILSIPPAYNKVIPEAYATPESLAFAENFELIILRDVCSYFIYRETVYEAADDLGIILNDQQVYVLLYNFLTIKFNNISTREFVRLSL